MESVVSPGKPVPSAPRPASAAPAAAGTAATGGRAAFATPLPDPLLTALSQLLGIFGTARSEDALASGIPHERPLQPAGFSRIAEAHGCKVRIQSRRIDQISDLLLPVILLLDRQQACLLLSRRGDRVVVLPCEAGAIEVEIGLDELLARYVGTCIFVRPAIHVEDRSIVEARPSGEDWFWKTIWRYKGYYAQAAAAAFLVNVLALATTFFTMNVYDRVISNQAYVTLWTLAAGVMVAMSFEYLARNLRSWLLDNAGKKADLLLGSALFRQAMMSRLEHRPQSAGAYANMLREFESVRDFATSATLATISDLPFMLLFVWVIYLIAGPLFWVPLAALPVLMLVGGLAQFPLSRYVNENLREGSVKHGILVEALESAETIKALRGESQMQAKYERSAALTARTAMKSRTVTALVSNFTTFVQSLCTVAIVTWGVYLIGDGELTMGALIGAVLLSSRTIAPAASITALAVRYQQARTALRSLNRVMATPTDRDSARNYLHKPTAAGSLTATGVGFHYATLPGTTPRESVSDISLQLNPGERVAVLGRIGSGKSTLLKVLAGLYQPTRGYVRLDGVDLQQIEPADVRRHVLYVGQDARLLFGSLRENLKAGNPHIDDESMMRVADAFGVHQFASAHPYGYDMPIGERGEGLSGGQRQAVALARAVLANPTVMLLDEPTSAMDNGSEAIAMAALARLCVGKTMVFVTHKLQLLEHVNRVVILDAGVRVADGPKEAVLQALKEGKIQGARRG
ncbi:MAG: type I secretion system permease/ATPase [Burkholderiaceae bacterium]|nr:type I secretion system permease/ATPase [Burkholderiaceae bacterium]